jgi:hypothetical protein
MVAVRAESRKRDAVTEFYVALQQKPPQSPRAYSGFASPYGYNSYGYNSYGYKSYEYKSCGYKSCA